MLISFLKLTKSKKCNSKYATTGLVLFIIFLIVSILTYECSPLLRLLGGIVACSAVVMIAVVVYPRRSNLVSRFSIKYTWPLFLCHSLFASTIRIVLLKLGISNPVIHILTGLIASFVGPILTIFVANKFKPFDFVFYPQRYIHIERPKATI